MFLFSHYLFFFFYHLSFLFLFLNFQMSLENLGEAFRFAARVPGLPPPEIRQPHVALGHVNEIVETLGRRRRWDGVFAGARRLHQIKMDFAIAGRSWMRSWGTSWRNSWRSSWRSCRRRWRWSRRSWWTGGSGGDGSGAHGTLFLDVEPLTQTRPVEEVAAEGDAHRRRAAGHGLVADGADVVVLGQLLLGGRGQGVDVLGGLTTPQIGEPARLEALPHVEVAVDDQDGRVGPRPLTHQRLVEAGAHDEHGH